MDDWMDDSVVRNTTFHGLDGITMAMEYLQSTKVDI